VVALALMQHRVAPAVLAVVVLETVLTLVVLQHLIKVLQVVLE
jgi:hypothetical protein